MTLNQILLAILFVALIVLVVYLTILVVNTIKTVKKANELLDDGIAAVDNVKEKAEDIKKFVVTSKVFGFADAGLRFARVAVKNKKNKKNKE